jgi:uncharacterized protein YjbI with pentapeptide repeats
VAHCKYHNICGRDALEGEDLCVLHSKNPDKDKERFVESLAEHRTGERAYDFSDFVFPVVADFSRTSFRWGAKFALATFAEGADFIGTAFTKGAAFLGAKFIKDAKFNFATFTRYANFSGSTFSADVNFQGATFSEGADFSGASFTEHSNFWDAKFHGATFTEDADFSVATFTKHANFVVVVFSKKANFSVTAFSTDANFQSTTFSEIADFSHASFLGRTFFGHKGGTMSRIFSGAQIDFRWIIVDPLDALTFRDADLQKTWFQGTDLRKAELVGVTWPKKGGRFRVYDEDAPLSEGETRDWRHIEHLYRQLKQNYEERKDYERAGDFHYGEKEMRRRNKDISWGLWFWLTMYWLVSGYGERWVRPLLWTAGVLLASTLSYPWWGILRVKDTGQIVDWSRFWETGLYSLKVMTLLKPTNFEPVGVGGDLIYTIQSIVGPLLIGLFALAVRQRLKR